jgi:hypothetical protein
MFKTAAFLLALSLSGCNATGSIGTPAANQTTTVAVGDTCVVATGLINVAIALNSKLTQPQKNAVTHAISVLRPVCTGPQPTIATTAEAAFRAAEVELVGATAGLKP